MSKWEKERKLARIRILCLESCQSSHKVLLQRLYDLYFQPSIKVEDGKMNPILLTKAMNQIWSKEERRRSWRNEDSFFRIF